MTGQDRPGIPGLSWSAFGGQRSPAAWGGGAAELQAPSGTVREAMRADEAAKVHLLPRTCPTQQLRPAFQGS